MIKNKTEQDSLLGPKKIRSQENIIIAILSNKIFLTIHAFLYVAVNCLLIMLWGISLSVELTPFLPLFPLLGWGIGISIHAATYLMYNDKNQFLIKLRKRSFFGVLLVYHAIVYGLANLIVITANIMVAPENLVFGWTLGMWGIIFIIHAVGIFTFESFLKKEIDFFNKRNPEFEDRKLSIMGKWKILNFWLLIANIAYFITGTIVIYLIPLSNMDLMYTLIWATSLGIHAFAYSFYYHVKSVKAANKGLIIHVVFLGATTAWGVFQLSIKGISTIPILFLIEPFFLWGILIGFHALVAHNWTSILANTVKLVKKQVGDGLNEYKIVSRAKWLVFWNWTLIAHCCVFTMLLTFSAIQVSINILPSETFLHIAFGEGIGLSVHGAISYIYLRNIRKFWKWTFVLHLVSYVVTGAYLIVLNILYLPGIPVSAVALGGWGIGLGTHYILARFSKSQ